VVRLLRRVEGFMTEAYDRTALAKRRPRRPRRVVEDVLIAFHQACDLQDREIAWGLIIAAENAMRFETTAKAAEQIRMATSLVSAHERLWRLFHKGDLAA